MYHHALLKRSQTWHNRHIHDPYVAYVDSYIDGILHGMRVESTAKMYQHGIPYRVYCVSTGNHYRGQHNSAEIALKCKSIWKALVFYLQIIYLLLWNHLIFMTICTFEKFLSFRGKKAKNWHCFMAGYNWNGNNNMLKILHGIIFLYFISFVRSKVKEFPVSDIFSRKIWFCAFFLGDALHVGVRCWI